MATTQLEEPYYPIIYVRGYAGTDSDIEDTISDPYMGFNLGSTRIRTLWTGETEKYYFESPLVRLMKDYGYRDVYSAGLNIADIDKAEPGAIEADSDAGPVARTYAAYEREIARRGGLDFDDLVARALRLLASHASVLAEWRERCTHLLVDEAQDLDRS